MSNIPVAAKSHANNFGFLRLVFASLVIVSHSPEFIDGNRSREILTRVFGTMSFGELAVYGFFLISGYLITKSFVEGRSIRSYFINRIARIVPGYLVSFLACVFLLGPFVGAAPALHAPATYLDLLFRIVTLRAPDVVGTFPDQPYPSLNGPMWTIAYEFRCYLAAALAGVLGLYRPRYRTFLLVMGGLLLMLNASDLLWGVHTRFDYLHGIPRYTVEFASVFGVGALFYLFRDRVPLTGAGAAVAAVLCVALMFSPTLAYVGFAVFGGYVIFWFALKAPFFGASRLTNKTDISYGLYLYACPIQQCLISIDHTINPWLLCGITLVGAGALGLASWTFVEKPAMRYARGRSTIVSTGSGGDWPGRLALASRRSRNS